jgi:hypothetical protein
LGERGVSPPPLNSDLLQTMTPALSCLLSSFLTLFLPFFLQSPSSPSFSISISTAAEAQRGNKYETDKALPFPAISLFFLPTSPLLSSKMLLLLIIEPSRG